MNSKSHTQLKKVLQPVLSLLDHNDSPFDPDFLRRLLDFFADHGVVELSDLAKFDYEVLSERFDHGSSHQEHNQTLQDLDSICRYIALFGEQAFLGVVAEATNRQKESNRNTDEGGDKGHHKDKRQRTLKDENNGKDEGKEEEKIGKKIDRAGIQGVHPLQSLPIRLGLNTEQAIAMVALSNISLQIQNQRHKSYVNGWDEDICQIAREELGSLTIIQTRDILRLIFGRKGCVLHLMHQGEEEDDEEEEDEKDDEDEFPYELVLALLTRFPMLASLYYYPQYGMMGARGIALFPFHFFAFCGAPTDIVRQVFLLYPQVEQKDEVIIRFIEFVDQETRVPLNSFQSLLEVHPQPARGGNDYDGGKLLFERLCNMKYNDDVLGYVQSFLTAETVDDLSLTHYMLYLGSSKASLINKIIPRVRRLEFGQLHWGLVGSRSVFRCLASTLHPKLESLKLSILVADHSTGTYRLHPHIIGRVEHSGDESENCGFRENLQRLLRNKMETPATQDIHLEIGGEIVQQSEALHQIASCVSSTETDWHLNSLTLKGMTFDDNFAANIFSQDHLGALDVQLDGLRFQCPWDPVETATKGLRLERLNLYDVTMPKSSWDALWRGVSGLSKLDRVMLAPGERGNQASWINTALVACSTLSSLTTLSLGPHTNDHTIFDITKPLITLLNHGSLEFLQVEGSYEDHDGNIGCLSYQIVVDKICQALNGNKALQFLFLRGVKLVGENISKAFLSVLDDYNNTTIEFADICDDQYFYTIIPKDSWRRDIFHGFTYESYPDAWQIYYLTSFNRYGRSGIQHKTTTLKELVSILDSVHSGSGITDEEQRSHNEIVETAIGGSREDPANFINQLYVVLSKDPSLWCNAVKRNIEALGIRYAILREKPCLWDKE